MKDLFRTLKIMLKDTKLPYALNFVFQFLIVFFTLFSQFLLALIVDVFDYAADPSVVTNASVLEIWVAELLGGQGSLEANFEYLWSNWFIFPITLISVGVMYACFVSIRTYLRCLASTRMTKNLQLTLFEKMERLPYEEYKTNKPGDLLQACTRDLDVVRRFLVMDFSQFTYTLWNLCLGFTVLMTMSWKLTLVSISLMPIMFLYSFFLIRIVRKRYKATDDSEAEMTGRINENLAAVRIVKAYNAESYEINRFEGNLTDYKGKFIKWRKLSSFFFASTDVFIFLARSMAIVYAIYLSVMGEITPGTVVVSFTFVNMIVWPLRQSATSLSNLGQVLGANDRITQLMNKEDEDVESGLTPEIKGGIEFRHVCFAYPDEPDAGVLDDVSFVVKPGQTIAIMGKTGSGKSTLAALLTRLYEPDSGEILIDGIPLNEISKNHLRRNLVPVLQDPFLFSKTIEENILLAKPSASKKEMREATKIAAIDKAIRSFSQGYETPVGEHGVTLSGGQKQRVAIARSIISGAPVLIFDDSLSAVDTQTDLEIRSQLKQLKNKTTIIVTHRVMSAKDADIIIVLGEGKIEDMGTNDELLSRGGLYSRVASIQEKII